MSNFNYDLLTVINFVEGVIMPSLDKVAEWDRPVDQDLGVNIPCDTRTIARAEAREYRAEMRAMGYKARKSNSKSKAVMLRKRGRI